MSKLPAIAPTLAHLEHVPISKLAPFQGDLKDLSVKNYKRLCGQLLENGIIVPFFVWVDSEGVFWILDGHQRDRVFTGEGWQIDVPIIRIDATDRTDAKQKLLAISSQYGAITQEGWDEFTFDLPDGWALENVHFDALPFVFGDMDLPDAPDEWKEYDESAADDVQYIDCPHCGERFPK